TEPRRPAGARSRIGYGWHITGEVTWHNGMTGGFASWIGFDRGGDRAVVILTNTSNSVDSLGFSLMGAE
ncbi:serine hydrolase, partial [Brevundimonas sp.]|uniref:serine hydrolase n=1 Tax=Brevundimonas sp. TaxID=1871086 RepID=UPI0035662AD4